MTNTKMLKDYISNMGIPITTLAKKCGLSAQSFYHKLDGKTEFKQSEIVAIKEALRLTSDERDAIFFAQ